MDFISLSSSIFSPQFLVTAAIFTFVTVLLSFRFYKTSPPPTTAPPDSDSRSKRMCCNCSCHCNGGSVNNDENNSVSANSDSTEYVKSDSETFTASGASMMEQLVPEISTHALSYLDYPSLCRLSMTNSLMRRAANDDNAWKALYQKDFTLEQQNVMPANGWKSYYAATRAVVNVNTEFFNIINDRSLQQMGRFWLNADYVKCIHASGELFSGLVDLNFNETAIQQELRIMLVDQDKAYTLNNSVKMTIHHCIIAYKKWFAFLVSFCLFYAVFVLPFNTSWQLAFGWAELHFQPQVRDVRVRVLTDMAWVTMKTFINVNARPFNMTNIYEHHNGRWCMVHHHSSLLLNDGDGQQQHG
ncbi:hypothetical protein ACFE04_006354 [Oxalis oulophora]